MIGTRLQRHLGEPRELQPGQYCTTEIDSMSGVTVHVHIKCPDCGGVDTVGAKRVVGRGGSGHAKKWRCPTETCGFEQPLEFESWEATA